MKETGKVNIRTISKITGFSPATVSNALNYKRGVKKETSLRIFEVAKDLGYVVNSQINKVRFVIFRKAGSVIEDNPFFSKVMRGAEEMGHQYGFETSVTYLDMRLSTYQDDLARLLADKTCGFVMLGSELEESELPHFMKSGAPLVFLDFWHDDMNCEYIINNNTESVQLLVEHLVEKGHRKIGYIQGDLRMFPFRERERSLRRSLSRHGIPLQDKYIFTVALSMEDSYNSMMRLLDEGLELPTAFFVDNDVMAVGCMQAMKAKGIRLPEDVSLVSYDDIPMSNIITPRLSTIHTEMEALGRLAAQKIITLAEDPQRPKSSTVFSTAFIERDSVYDLTKHGG